MNAYITDCLVPLGDFDWYPLKKMGNRYFMLAIKPLFKGYYALEPCDFPNSRLNTFLNSKFMSFLKEGGVDISAISAMGILTQGQYNMYVKDKLPLCGEYLLQTPNGTDKSQVLAVKADGSFSPVPVTSKANIRPCFFIDADYLDSICDEPVLTVEDFYKNPPIEPDSTSMSETVQEPPAAQTIPEPQLIEKTTELSPVIPPVDVVVASVEEHSSESPETQPITDKSEIDNEVADALDVAETPIEEHVSIVEPALTELSDIIAAIDIAESIDIEGNTSNIEDDAETDIIQEDHIEDESSSEIHESDNTTHSDETNKQIEAEPVHIAEPSDITDETTENSELAVIDTNESKNEILTNDESDEHDSEISEESTECSAHTTPTIPLTINIPMVTAEECEEDEESQDNGDLITENITEQSNDEFHEHTEPSDENVVQNEIDANEEDAVASDADNIQPDETSQDDTPSETEIDNAVENEELEETDVNDNTQAPDIEYIELPSRITLWTAPFIPFTSNIPQYPELRDIVSEEFLKDKIELPAYIKSDYTVLSNIRLHAVLISGLPLSYFVRNQTDIPPAEVLVTDEEPSTENIESVITHTVVEENGLLYDGDIPPQPNEEPEKVEILESGHRIETYEDDVIVYAYQDEHKDFGFIVDNDDAKLKDSISRISQTIKAYFASATNEERKPMERVNVTDHISRLQRRWRW